MKIFNLLTIFLLAYLCSAHYVADNDANKSITKRYEINDLWSDACSVIGLFDRKKSKGKIAKLFKKSNFVCSMGNIIFEIGAKVGRARDSHREHYQIPRGQCKNIYISEFGTTEICSHGPNRLYGDWRSVSVYGCYNFGKAGTESFTECCVMNTGSVGVALNKKMCSGPASGVENVNFARWLSYPQCAYRTYLLNQQCSGNVSSNTCDNLAERMITECKDHP